MYNVTVEKQEYDVKFRHLHFSPCPIPYCNLPEQNATASTLCWIMSFVSGEKESGVDPSADPGVMSVIGDGIAYCHRNDIFNKNTGRKLSLARALKDAGFDRNVRELFWRGYFEARGKIG